MPHIDGQYPPMEKDSKWHQIQTIVNLLTIKTPKEYSILWEPCYIIPSQFIQQLYYLLMKYLESNQSQQGTLRKNKKCYYTMLQHTKM